MTMLDHAVDGFTGAVVSIGLATGPDATDEITGGGYTPLAPAYDPAASNSADIGAVLEFAGPPNAGPVTHIIFRDAGGIPADGIRPVVAPASFNAAGQLNLTAAVVAAAYA